MLFKRCAKAFGRAYRGIAKFGLLPVSFADRAARACSERIYGNSPILQAASYCCAGAAHLAMLPFVFVALTITIPLAVAAAVIITPPATIGLIVTGIISGFNALIKKCCGSGNNKYDYQNDLDPQDPDEIHTKPQDLPGKPSADVKPRGATVPFAPKNPPVTNIGKFGRTSATPGTTNTGGIATTYTPHAAL